MIPSVADERAIALGRRHVEYEPQLRTPWRSNGMLLSIVFFVLTSFAVLALYMLLQLMNLPKGVPVLVVSLTVAEVLIRRLRFFGTGVEAALWLAGLFALVFDLPGRSEPEALLLFALASIVAAARVRNPWFGVLALVLVLVYLDFGRGWKTPAMIVAIASCVLAVAALSREWARPSTETFFSIAVVILPVAGAIAGRALFPDLSAGFAVLAVLMICAGIFMRHHAPLVAAGVSIVIAAIGLYDVIPWPAEWQLIAAGAILLGCSAVVSRLLRGRTRGIVIGPSGADDDTLELISTVQISPAVDLGPREERGGGAFGGAGASGEF